MGVIRLPASASASAVSGESNADDSDPDELKSELNYVAVLNRLLPREIRVTGWAPVSLNFDAR